MKRVDRILAIAAALAMVAFASVAVDGTGEAGAEQPLQPLDLRVEGGEDAWHPERGFVLRWSNPQREAAPVADVHYRLLAPNGEVAETERTTGWAATVIDRLRVPATPGAYTAEVWLEDSSGAEGPPATAKLRFDDAHPGNVEPLAPDLWLGRGSFPYRLSLTPAASPAPLSGLRGYAVALDRSADGEPCAAAATCAEAETNLRGAEASTLTIADLPEGTSYAHAVAVSGSGIRSTAVGTAALRVDETDPVTELSGVPPGWSTHPVALVATASDSASGMARSGGGDTPFTAIQVDGAVPVTAPGASAAATVVGSGVHAVAYYARDAAGNANDGGIVRGQRNRPPAQTLVRIDGEPPRLAFANAQDPREPERIEALVADPLSGPDPSRGEIAVRRAGSGDRFTALPTRTGDGVLQAHWDSAAFPPGAYEFRAVAFDVAGNSSASLRRGSGAAMVLDNPLKAPTTLVTGFGGAVLDWHRCKQRLGQRRCREQQVAGYARRPARRTVPYGRAVAFSGRLIAGRHTPLAGTPVRIVESFETGASEGERTTTVTTASNGSFGVQLAAGPSREVRAAVPATATLAAASSRPVSLAVQTGVSLRVSSHSAEVGGRPLVFSGRVASAGATIPPGGKAVQLQFRLPGVPWSEFRTVKTGSAGRFRFAYGFSDDDSRGVRFLFRAFAPAQAGWPFEPAGSRPVAVRGS